MKVRMDYFINNLHFFKILLSLAFVFGFVCSKPSLFQRLDLQSVESLYDYSISGHGLQDFSPLSDLENSENINNDYKLLKDKETVTSKVSDLEESVLDKPENIKHNALQLDSEESFDKEALEKLESSVFNSIHKLKSSHPSSNESRIIKPVYSPNTSSNIDIRTDISNIASANKENIQPINLSPRFPSELLTSGNLNPVYKSPNTEQKNQTSEDSTTKDSVYSNLRLSQLHTNVVTRDTSPMQTSNKRSMSEIESVLKKSDISMENSSKNKSANSIQNNYDNRSEKINTPVLDLKNKINGGKTTNVSNSKDKVTGSLQDIFSSSDFSESSFSDLSDSSITKSALREAFLSQLESTTPSSLFPSKLFMWKNL
ncbi:hypothetical protein BB560_001794 [Smittium megazygosporum]|uniref:Uncharacterized protein n=1 Tax=Smittium megazygosporum TaxID=133381 RepID=A0A2T9ZGK4_9FUNG|nr:hypothetical protein BB560_001794 [Smittium megazygosporum]